MPRNGSGVYSLPDTYEAVSGETIEAQQHNDPLEDLESDANAARPIVAGGTGATTAVGAHDAFSTKGTSIASASTTDIGAATGKFVHITGTTTITALGTKDAGVERVVTFDGALTLTHDDTSLILPGADDITTAAGDTARFVSEGSGNWRCVSYTRADGQPISTRYSEQSLTPAQQAQARANISAALRGHIWGLTLSNNISDGTNDIDIAAGEAASDGSDPVLMVLASALTKRLDAAWAVGTGNGGLDTGTIANGTYHVWLIQRSDTGVVDALFSTSATSPTMPANYDRKRRIGSIIRDSGAILPFTQNGDLFHFTSPQQDRSSTDDYTDAVIAITTPAGVVVSPILDLLITASTSSDVSTWVGSGADSSAAIGVHTYSGAAAFSSHTTIPPGLVFTNTSSQIRMKTESPTGTFLNHVLSTLGWTDTRGRLA